MNLTEPPSRRASAQPVRPLTARVRAIVSLPTSFEPTDLSFWSALSSRRTTYGVERLHVTAAAVLLERACRTQPHSEGRRPWPSAGAVYPIEVLVEGVQDLDGLFRYRADTHELEELDVDATFASSLREMAASCLPNAPATLLWLIASEARTSAIYEHAESLIWRDAGALLATLHLTARALNLLAAPLGITGEPLLSQTPWSLPVYGVGAMNLALPAASR